MKRLFSLAVICLSMALTANAQYRGVTDGRYHRVYPSSHRYRSGGYIGWGHYNCPYAGLRIGPTFSTISGNDGNSSVKSGVNIGIAAGLPLSGFVPLYLESGLYYTEKGGKSSNGNVSAKLDYLEIPVAFKYIADLNGTFSIQPYLGGYAALGVGGNVKESDMKIAYSSFGGKPEQYRRGDAGIKAGVGVGIGMFYADVSYKWGLTNITHSPYYDGHTRQLEVNFGVNF